MAVKFAIPRMSGPAETAHILQQMVKDGAQIDCDQALEAQRLLEAEIAGLAASRCTPDDIDRLAQILEEAELSRDDPERFPQAEYDFRMALARATQDTVLLRLLSATLNTLPRTRRPGGRNLSAPGCVLTLHRAIFDQVVTGDAEAARQAMLDYLEQAAETIRQGLSPTAHEL